MERGKGPASSAPSQSERSERPERPERPGRPEILKMEDHFYQI